MMTSEITSDESWDGYEDETKKYFYDMPEVELMALDDEYQIRSPRTDFLKKIKAKGRKFTNDFVKPQKPLHKDLKQADLIQDAIQKDSNLVCYEVIKERFGNIRNILYLDSNYEEQLKAKEVMFLWCYPAQCYLRLYLPEILRAAHHIKVKWGDRVAIGLFDISNCPTAPWIPRCSYCYYYFSIFLNGKFKSQYRGDISASNIKNFVDKEYKEYQMAKKTKSYKN